MKPGLTPAQSVRLRATLCADLLRVGKVDAAIEQIDAAMNMAKRDPALENLLVGLYRIRGIAYLRKAEVENCIIRHNAECCLFPLSGGGVRAEVIGRLVADVVAPEWPVAPRVSPDRASLSSGGSISESFLVVCHGSNSTSLVLHGGSE